MQAEDPRWAPLEAALGMELAGWFMWMYEVRLDGGTLLDVYKHVTTRRYLHLASRGRAFAYRFDSSYSRVDLAAELAAAFRGWERAGPSRQQQQQLTVALASAQDRAE